MILKVKVVPKSAKSDIVEYKDDILKVKIAALPIKGQSNTILIELLSKFFNVPKKSISIVKGLKSKFKYIDINSCKQKIIIALKKLL